ncbi:hypothetical protein [Streptomyces sp. NPDC059701]|uniref:hypothetical protein n=1 Tax=Streptomyces sp. NPDC059701 TaxID=3346914 RepID=UPI0036AA9C32
MDRSTITRAIGEVRPLLAERGCAVSPGVRLRTLAEVVDHPRRQRQDRRRVHGGHGRGRPGAVLQPDQARLGSCADITHARQLGLVKLLADGPAAEIFADAGYQGLGAQTGGRMVTPPHRNLKKHAPDWYAEMYERQRKALITPHPGRTPHRPSEELAALTRHLGRREHMSHTVQAVAGLLSHQQTADLTSARQR